MWVSRETMDLSTTLRDLYAEKERLERVIAALEALRASGEGRDPGEKRSAGRRGRTSMSAEEREQVSRRMRAYWSARRENQERQEAPKVLPAVV